MDVGRVPLRRRPTGREAVSDRRVKVGVVVNVKNPLPRPCGSGDS